MTENFCGSCAHWQQPQDDKSDHGAGEKMARNGYKTCAKSMTKWQYVSHKAAAGDKFKEA